MNVPSSVSEQASRLSELVFAGPIAPLIITAVLSFLSGLILERYRAKHQFRMAVLERRFHAHQEAYSFWIKINAMKEDLNDLSFRTGLFNWWKDNALYLDPKPRRAVTGMIRGHVSIAERSKDRSLSGDKNIEDKSMPYSKAIEAIEAAGPIIEDAVGLPPIKGSINEALAKLLKGKIAD